MGSSFAKITKVVRLTQMVERANNCHEKGATGWILRVMIDVV